MPKKDRSTSGRHNHMMMVQFCWMCWLAVPATTAFHIGTTQAPTNNHRTRLEYKTSGAAEEALARTEAHLKRLKRRQSTPTAHLQEEGLHPQQQESILQEQLYQEYVARPASSLKQELELRRLNTQGRKPDLARRLAQNDVRQQKTTAAPKTQDTVKSSSSASMSVKNAGFAGVQLPELAVRELSRAGFLDRPSPIQKAAIPQIASGESVLMQAPTGSGKTIAYVLPITEYLWKQVSSSAFLSSQDSGSSEPSIHVIATPTQELAAQVAGIAATLAPPGCVRLLSHPSNLMKDKLADPDAVSTISVAGGPPPILVGSAKSIVESLYGNEHFPAPPTPKPLALAFLRSVRVLVLDEVDRSLLRREQERQERPAAVLAAAVAQHTQGRAQVVAASATVGQPLKRELARVLGLSPNKGPKVVVAKEGIIHPPQQQGDHSKPQAGTIASSNGTEKTASRLVAIPGTVQHFLAPVTARPDGLEDSASSGQLLVKAHQVVLDCTAENPNARILLVLARGFGISTQHVIGALQHFRCQPEPVSLLDALQENARGTEAMMQVHRKVSGATGVGQSRDGEKNDGVLETSRSSLWVTREDTIRGLHLDGLDVVVVVGRPKGPDEYTHIAGRTGRAGGSGKVVVIVQEEQAQLLKGWESMLQLRWKTYDGQDQ